MSRATFVKESLIHAPPERVFAFHELPDALVRLTPPWERVRVVQAAHIAQVGAEAIIETRMVTTAQVFLPYAVTKEGQTVYEYIAGHTQLLVGEGNTL